MTSIIKVVIDAVNDTETIMNDWCWAIDVNEDFVKDYKANDDGSISGIFDCEKDTIPFEELKDELKSMYRSIEYIGNGNYRCEEYRDWNTLTEDEKYLVLRNYKI